MGRSGRSGGRYTNGLGDVEEVTAGAVAVEVLVVEDTEEELETDNDEEATEEDTAEDDDDKEEDGEDDEEEVEEVDEEVEEEEEDTADDEDDKEVTDKRGEEEEVEDVEVFGPSSGWLPPLIATGCLYVTHSAVGESHLETGSLYGLIIAFLSKSYLSALPMFCQSNHTLSIKP
jgi:vacuolar-type H+-ATPase subunit I/STV1